MGRSDAAGNAVVIELIARWAALPAGVRSQGQ